MLSVYDVSVEVVNRLATETNMLIPTSFPTSSEKMNLELMQVLDFIGVNDGVRTRDNRNHNPGLYQLSYAHHNDILWTRMARLAGVEPATHGLEGRCSIQLSYKRKSWSG